MDLQGKTSLVIGAGSVSEEIGNGRAIAILFARHGAHVICADLNLEAAEATADSILQEGGSAQAVAVDASKEDQVRDLVESTVGDRGRLDVLQNNVGVATVGGVVDTDVDTWDRDFDINLKSAFLAMKFAIPHMVSAGTGAIVNTSSVASIRWSGVPYATYYATKAAMNHLTKTTAIEFAPRGVRVNAVLPGLIRTPMVAQVAGLTEGYRSRNAEEMWATRDRQVPLGYMGSPWDVAEAALFLASDRSKYLTGVELVVDGGISLGFSQ